MIWLTFKKDVNKFVVVVSPIFYNNLLGFQSCLLIIQHVPVIAIIVEIDH